jgi:hypothetical protein
MLTTLIKFTVEFGLPEEREFALEIWGPVARYITPHGIYAPEFYKSLLFLFLLQGYKPLS